MKCFSTLFIFTILFTSFTEAQIVINSSNIGQAGDEYIMAYDDNPDSSLKIGDPGANLTWDFSSLQLSYLDTVRYFHPDSTPYAGRFPQANLAILQNNNTMWGFLVNNTFEFSIYGAVLPVPEIGIVDFDLVPKDVMAFWPLEYQDYNNLSFVADIRVESTEPLIDSIRYKSTTFKTSEVDAWGTMNIPIGSFQVLRVFEQRTMIDSIWTKFIGTWIFISRTVDSIKIYNWWTNHPVSGYTLVTANMDSETMEIDDISYLNYPYVDVPERMTDIRQLVVYPNPVGEVLYMQLPVAGRQSPVASRQLPVASIDDFRFEVLDVSGRLVQCGMIDKSMNLSVSKLESGLYLLKISSGSVMSTAKFIKK